MRWQTATFEGGDDMIIQLLAALVGSLGFAALFNLHGKKLIVSARGGLGAWAIYLALNSGV